MSLCPKEAWSLILWVDKASDLRLLGGLVFLSRLEGAESSLLLAQMLEPLPRSNPGPQPSGDEMSASGDMGHFELIPQHLQPWRDRL